MTDPRRDRIRGSNACPPSDTARPLRRTRHRVRGTGSACRVRIGLPIEPNDPVDRTFGELLGKPRGFSGISVTSARFSIAFSDDRADGQAVERPECLRGDRPDGRPRPLGRGGGQSRDDSHGPERLERAVRHAGPCARGAGGCPRAPARCQPAGRKHSTARPCRRRIGRLRRGCQQLVRSRANLSSRAGRCARWRDRRGRRTGDRQRGRPAAVQRLGSRDASDGRVDAAVTERA